MKDQIENLLYHIPENVDYTDFDEELDLEDISLSRIEGLKKLLKSNNSEYKFRAAFLLSNWGIDEGYDTIIDLLNEEEVLENQNYESHRLNGYNIVYEQILNAIIGFKSS